MTDASRAALRVVILLIACLALKLAICAVDLVGGQ
jgi:hypothetical protein